MIRWKFYEKNLNLAELTCQWSLNVFYIDQVVANCRLTVSDDLSAFCFTCFYSAWTHFCKKFILLFLIKKWMCFEKQRFCSSRLDCKTHLNIQPWDFVGHFLMWPTTVHCYRDGCWTTVFHRLEAARLVFRIKAAAASISNKSRAAYIWDFHFYLRRKKIGKQCADSIWRKK